MASEQQKKYYTSKLNTLRIPIKITGTFFNRVILPTLPTNYLMLLSDIDFPEKAKKNPNGSLFMKPTEEILRNKSQDYGLKFFSGNINFKGIYNFDLAKDKNDLDESNDIYSLLQRYNNNSVIQALLEDDLNPASHGSGANINQHTRGRETGRVTTFDGNVIDAIDQYITSSLIIVDKLVKIICGDSVDVNKKITGLIQQMNSVAVENLNEWVTVNDEYIKALTNTKNREREEKLQNANIARRKAFSLVYMLSINKNTGLDAKTTNDLINKLKEEIESDSVEEGDLDKIVKKYIKNVNGIDKAIKILTPGKNNESFKVQGRLSRIPDSDYAYKLLNEDADSETVSNIKGIDFDILYNRIQKLISKAMLEVVSSDITKWASFKLMQERMKALKDGATNEINTKIDLICRTANSGNVDIGDKFKAAISKHPVRAATLKNLWIRYSDDLDGRIETRLKSITGENGSNSAYNTIREFLVNTYPNLIAMMLTMKNIFSLLKIINEKYGEVRINEEECMQELITRDMLRVGTAITYFEKNV